MNFLKCGYGLFCKIKWQAGQLILIVRFLWVSTVLEAEVL